MKKVAMVTGASRGTGKAMAERLVRDGFAVVVNYAKSASEAEQVVSDIKTGGGDAIADGGWVGELAGSARQWRVGLLTQSRDQWK